MMKHRLAALLLAILAAGCRVDERQASPSVVAGKSTTPYCRSWLFAGACRDTEDAVAVWIGEVLRPDSDRTRRIRVLPPTPTLGDRALRWTVEAERRPRARVSAGRCREVPPLDQFVA